MTLKEHAEKCGVAENILQMALDVENTQTSRPAFAKVTSVQVCTGCAKKEAKDALVYVFWENLVTEV